MKKMKFVFLFVAIVVAGSLIASYYILNMVDTKLSKEPVVVEATFDSTDNSTTLDIVEPQSIKEIEKEYPLDMEEKAVQDEIHGMSHQKIQAEQKWLFTPMTTERIERLIEVIEANEYNHEQLYLDILNRWAAGDFSRADRDHNAIWSLQGGTIGKATGLLSPEEEMEFIKQYYKVEIKGKQTDTQ